MKSFVISAALFCAFVGQAIAGCGRGLQGGDINYSKLAGRWMQEYYTPVSAYARLSCYESYIYAVDTDNESLRMRVEVAGLSKRKKTIRRTIETSASWSDDKLPHEENIKDHIITDYKNYLIFYQCPQGTPIVSIELREGVSRLSAAKTSEVSDILEKIDVDLFGLSRRNGGSCGEK